MNDNLNFPIASTTIPGNAPSVKKVFKVPFDPNIRPQVKGKFIFIGDQKFWVRGVTYGTFSPDTGGIQFPNYDVVCSDFAAIAKNNMNTVRVYTVPPLWLLDIAQRHHLRVVVGLPWEQHIAFLDEKSRAKAIENNIREAVRNCSKHPAILCYCLGNEIPASIVRWHGRQRIEMFLSRLYRIGKFEDPEGLFTYVNFPTTEYLQLPFLDLLSFNVYLESREAYNAYLARLQIIADERPLLMAEMGLDSRCNGEDAQAKSLDWQVRDAYAGGCAGAIVFAWTDEWYCGGHNIEDWDFGLTTRDRSPKPALATVCKIFSESSFPSNVTWPRISVVVCSLNGGRTIRDTLEGLQKLDYPDYEVILVNDGSTDNTAKIASEYDVRLISTENCGLSNARNTGLKAATGEIVAYTDDDAYPDPHWLKFLAHTFMTTSHVGVGGPNISPPGDGMIADCVANAPGGPRHVLISDQEAEHIPGCNKAFRKQALEAIGGFDSQFRAAGDDVDLCWRLMEKGGTLGFNPAALVWHHCRNSIKAYWKQQQGYGKAEALLEQKWPEKYSAVGHLRWRGRIYGKGQTQPVNGAKWRIYQGMWGTALFQSIYQQAPGTLLSLPLMPEWYLMIAFLGMLSIIGALWSPLLLAFPLFIIALVIPIIQGVKSARLASFSSPPSCSFQKLKMQAWTAYLHLIQPIARLTGRLSYGLTPWRYRCSHAYVRPLNRIFTIWSETWKESHTWLASLETALRKRKIPVFRGGDFDHWDLELRGGLFGSFRTLMAIEEHGSGRQLIRFRAWPKCSTLGIMLLLIFTTLMGWASMDQAWVASVLLGAITLLLGFRMVQECTFAAAALEEAFKQEKMSFE